MPVARVPRVATTVLLNQMFVRVMVPGVPIVTVDPLVVEGMPPLVDTLNDMHGLADKNPATDKLPDIDASPKIEAFPLNWHLSSLWNLVTSVPSAF